MSQNSNIYTQRDYQSHAFAQLMKHYFHFGNMALPVCLYYVSTLVTAAGRWNSAVWGWCEMRSLLINWFWVLVLGLSIELLCKLFKKFPSYHRLHAGHGAPGSSCSTYTSCHRCHMSNGSYLHSNERARLWVTHTQAETAGANNWH